MLALQIFVQVQTFWRRLLALSSNFCHPDYSNNNKKGNNQNANIQSNLYEGVADAVGRLSTQCLARQMVVLILNLPDIEEFSVEKRKLNIDQSTYLMLVIFPSELIQPLPSCTE